MKDLERSIREAGERFVPPSDWLERTGARVRRRSLRRRTAAAAVAMATISLLLIPFLLQLRSDGSIQRPAASYLCPAPKATGYWRADGTGADSTGRWGAQLEGTATFGSGVAGQAFELGGSGYVQVPEAPALDVGTGDFTISLWVSFESTSGEQVLAEDFVETFDKSTSSGWTLTKVESGELVLGLGRAGGVSSQPLELPTGEWIHVAASRAGSELTLFLDGKRIATHGVDNPSLSIDSDSSLKFGHRGGPQDTPGSLDDRGFYLNGSIDDIVFEVGHAASRQEIRNLATHPGAACV